MDTQYTTYFDFALKAEGESDGKFDGYASTFGNRDLQGDIVERGAFAETLKAHGGRVPILMGHVMQKVVGFGTHAEEDPKGLRVEGEFTLDSDEGRNAYAIARHASKVGHKFGLSIGYRPRKDGVEWDEATGVRRLKSLDLYEYSLAAIPANPRARISRVKSASEWSPRDIEDILREAGMSRDKAAAVATYGFRALGQGEPDGTRCGDQGEPGAAAKRAEAFNAALRRELYMFQLNEVFHGNERI